MKVLGVTLARGGSKGIPGKNIRPIANLPLLAWTLREAQAAQHLTNYIVSTDDLAIARVARQYGVQVVDRPQELAEDNTPTLPALQHAVGWAETVWGRFDIVVDLRCTNPLKNAADIDNAIKLLIETGAESVIGVGPAPSAERIKRVVDGRIVDILPEPMDGQRQNLLPSYIRNGSIYALRRDVLDDKLFGHADSRAYIMPKERSVNIDDMNDWLLAERLLNETRRD